MRIYDVENFPNPVRVRIALAEKGVTDAVQFEQVDVAAGEHRTAEFVAKNIGAAVPVLELDDGTCISESAAITEYIDHAFPAGISLTGENPKERAVVSMQQARAESMVLEPVSDFFHHATEGLGPELETYQNREWGEKRREKALKGMEFFDDVLALDDFVAGEAFSVADITLFAGLAFADFAGIGTPSHLQHLAAWRERMNQRSSIAAM